MTHYWWCNWCHSNVVPQSGEPCALCKGTLAAMENPIARPPLPRRAPAGVRFLHWLTGRTAA